MRWAAALACLYLLHPVTPTRADNPITASATDSGGKVAVSGTITFNSCNTLGGSITIDVFKEGCLDSTFTITTPTGSSPLSFSGTSSKTFAAGGYTVIATITITPSGACSDDYAVKTTVVIGSGTGGCAVGGGG